MTDTGGEKPDFGLYSYALVVNNSGRSAKFLHDVFSAIVPAEDLPAQRSQVNLFSIPLKKNKAKELDSKIKVTSDLLVQSSIEFAKEFYDYKMARELLNHLCESPAEEIKAVCEGDLSRGPYIFSYAKPASKFTPVPPPFLFMDMSDVHERAFPELIAAFTAQVKREDISDRAKIDTLRLQVLSIALTAADWLAPVHKAVAGIVYGPSEQSKKKKK